MKYRFVGYRGIGSLTSEAYCVFAKSWGGWRKLAGKDFLRPENGRKPWNDFQDSVVVSLYGETSDERLAAELAARMADN